MRALHWRAMVHANGSACALTVEPSSGTRIAWYIWTSPFEAGLWSHESSSASPLKMSIHAEKDHRRKGIFAPGGEMTTDARATGKAHVPRQRTWSWPGGALLYATALHPANRSDQPWQAYYFTTAP